MRRSKGEPTSVGVEISQVLRGICLLGVRHPNKMPRLIGAMLALLTMLLSPTSGHADNATDPWDDSWSESEQAQPEATTKPPFRPPFTLLGSVQTTQGLWANRLDSQPWAVGRLAGNVALQSNLSWLRLVVSGHGERDLAYLMNGQSHDQATLDVYRSQVRFGESFLAVRGVHWELAGGNLVTAWGDSEMITVLDMVSPTDMREPGLADLSELRLPVLSTRAGLYIGAHRLEVVALHEANFGLRAPPLGTFGALRAPMLQAGFDEQIVDILAAQGPMWRDTPDRFGMDSQQLFARWLYQGSWSEWGLYGASLLDPTGLLVLPPGQDHRTGRMAIDIEHPRYLMVGTSGLIPRGNWIVRWELAGDVGRSVQYVHLREAQQVPELMDRRHNLIHGLLGMRYAGPRYGVFAAEYGQGFRLGPPPEEEGMAILLPFLVPTAALRWEQAYLRGRIHSEIMIMVTGENLRGGAFGRAEVRYEPVDALYLTLGLAKYQPGAAPSLIKGFDHHDRIYLKARWSTAWW